MMDVVVWLRFSEIMRADGAANPANPTFCVRIPGRNLGIGKAKISYLDFHAFTADRRRHEDSPVPPLREKLRCYKNKVCSKSTPRSWHKKTFTETFSFVSFALGNVAMVTNDYKDFICLCSAAQEVLINHSLMMKVTQQNLLTKHQNNI